MKLIVVYILIFGLKLISPEQMDKLWHIQMIDYCTAMRKNDLQLNRAFMNLTNINTGRTKIIICQTLWKRIYIIYAAKSL